jgi:hypothetical protein
MSINHNVLYKTWADRPGLYTDTPSLKCKKERKKNVKKKRKEKLNKKVSKKLKSAYAHTV